MVSMKGISISPGPGNSTLSLAKCVSFLLLLILLFYTAVSAAVPRLAHASTKNCQTPGLWRRLAADVSIYQYNL